MNERQEAHLARIQKKVHYKLNKKYRAGAEEHGGELEIIPHLDILNMALDEAIDQCVYLISAIEQEEERLAHQY